MPVVQKLPVTVPELVESSPSLAADGSLVIGSRHTNVYLLDAKTGLLDHMFVDVASVSSSLDGLPGEAGKVTFIASGATFVTPYVQS